MVLAAVNVVGVKESAGLNVFLALADFLTQLILVVAGVALVLSPETLVNNIDFGTYPTVGDFLIAIPVGMVAYTGIETISNMAEEARDYGKTIPQGMAGVVAAVVAIYALAAVGGALGDAGGGRKDAAGASEGGRRLRERPGARRRGEHEPRLAPGPAPRSTWASWPPRSSLSPPTPG